MHRPPFLASCWTCAGNARPLVDDERSPVPIGERLAAISAAGFAGFGLTHADIVELRDTIGFEALGALIAEHDLRLFEVEMLMDWYESGDRRAASDRVRDDLLDAAAALGAPHMKVGVDYEDRHWDHEHIVESFRQLCAAADAAGVKVAVEPQAFCHVKTPEHAMRIIADAESATAGLCIDIWHLERIGYDLSRLERLPGDRIYSIELNDADAEPVGALIDDTILNRRFPGRGSFDLDTFITALDRTGFAGVWGIEVLSDELRAMPVREGLATVMSTTGSVFDAISSPTRP